MAKVRLYHPELQVEISVPEESAWVYLESDWQFVESQPEPTLIHDTAGPPVPVQPEEPQLVAAEPQSEPEDEESKGFRWGRHAKE